MPRKPPASQGLIVVPAPSYYRGFPSSPEEFLPSWKAIYRNDVTMHELLGLAWYWMHGWA
jgi:hypothetical protein